MNTKHTPGPWIIGKSYTSEIAIREPEGECVAVCCDSIPEMEANGCLIASAPELLELAHATLSYCEDDSRSERRRIAMIKGAKQVIKQAG